MNLGQGMRRGALLALNAAALGVLAAVHACSASNVSSAVGPAGGTVTLSSGPASGASVQIPPGALANTVAISIAPGSVSGLPGDLVAVGPAVAFGPEGQTFSSPVTVTVPTTGAAAELYTRPLGGATWSVVAGAIYDGGRSVVSAEVTHFSEFVAVASSSNSRLSGPYAYGFYQIDPRPSSSGGPPQGVATVAGVATFDGNGAVSVTATRNEDGTATAQQPPSGTYSVAGDGTVSFSVGNLQTSGSLLDGGSAAVMTATSGTPTLFVALRKSGAFSTASLNGQYWYGFIQAQPRTAGDGSVEGFATIGGVATFDGAGNVTVSATRNEDGTVTSQTPPPGTYAVSSDGTVTFTVGSLNATGRLLDGAKVVLLTAVSGSPTLLVAVKKAGAFSTASLTGDYAYGFYETQARALDGGSMDGFATVAGVATFDGAGNVTVTAKRNQDGTVTTALPPAGTYSVSADGAISFVVGNLNAAGGMLEGGELVVLASSSGNPILLVATKR